MGGKAKQPRAMPNLVWSRIIKTFAHIQALRHESQHKPRVTSHSPGRKSPVTAQVLSHRSWPRPLFTSHGTGLEPPVMAQTFVGLIRRLKQLKHAVVVISPPPLFLYPKPVERWVPPITGGRTKVPATECTWNIDKAVASSMCLAEKL
jgi:hypothetical protein